MSVGLGVVGGIVAFLCVEKMVSYLNNLRNFNATTSCLVGLSKKLDFLA